MLPVTTIVKCAISQAILVPKSVKASTFIESYLLPWTWSRSPPYNQNRYYLSLSLLYKPHEPSKISVGWTSTKRDPDVRVPDPLLLVFTW